MTKLRHDRVVAIESKEHNMKVQEIDQQIDKLKVLENRRRREGGWLDTNDFEGAVKLREQLKHTQAEYDALSR